MIIDTHAHTNDEKLIPFKEEILAYLNENMSAYNEVGCNFESSMAAIKLAEENKKVWAVIGTHPQDALTLTDEQLKEYERLSKHPKVVAIGEIGLDYYYEDPVRDIQKEIFRKQLEMATRTDLPVVLHIRDAYKDAYDILNEYYTRLKGGILMHCYSGSKEMVREFSKFDCYFALGGATTFKNAKKEDVIKAIPKDRLLLETDCPYMTPVPFRGKPNKPEYVRFVAEKIADTLETNIENVINQTTENAKRLFFKMKIYD